MFTKNYMNLKRTRELGVVYSIVPVFGTTYPLSTTECVPGEGILCAMRYAKCQGFATESVSDDTDYIGLWFGSGATPATADDYCLESPITEGLTIVNNGRIETSDGESTWTFTASYFVTNTTETTISIYEMGLVCLTRCHQYSYKYYFQTLMERTVLSEPIVIEPGETKNISYSITFNHTS